MRYIRFRLHELFFIGLFIGGDHHVRILRGLPDDTRFVRWFQQNGWIEVVVESAKFDLLDEGDEIPIIEIVAEKLSAL